MRVYFSPPTQHGSGYLVRLNGLPGVKDDFDVADNGHTQIVTHIYECYAYNLALTTTPPVPTTLIQLSSIYPPDLPIKPPVF